MANYPPRGTRPYDIPLKSYIDDAIEEIPKGDTGDIGDAVDLGNVTSLDFSGLVLGTQVVRCVVTTNLLLASTKMPSVPAGKAGSFTVKFVQDSVGGHAVTTTGILWAEKVAPVLASAPGSVTYWTFMWDGTTWVGFQSSANAGAPV